uniref:Armadillo repeat-containing protein 8 n=1 Tax=Romanomermis culicivorax TaxID=13658 RepID=A0A915J598_ROMCU
MAPLKDLLSRWHDGVLDNDLCGHFMRRLKHSIIGSVSQKNIIFTDNYASKLLDILKNGFLPAPVRCDAAVIVGSLAVRNNAHVRNLVDYGTIPILLEGLKDSDTSFIEACLKALETIFSTKIPSVEELYKDDATVELLIKAGKESARTNESLGLIIMKTCQVKSISLNVLSTICFNNVANCEAVARASHMGIALLDQIKRILSREIELDVRLSAARCMTYLARCDAVPIDDIFISKQVMPLLVRCCKFENNLLFCTKRRVVACETLFYLIEHDQSLQYLVSWNNMCLKTLGQCLTVTDPDASIEDDQECDNLLDDLHKAAFNALAAMASNTEDLRRKIMQEVHNLTDRVFNGLYASITVQIASLKCLHYLSRSVEQLRTVFMDKPASRQLLQLVQSENRELACTASAVLCNLLLEFSPCKYVRELLIFKYPRLFDSMNFLKTLIECGCVEVICRLISSEDIFLRLNGVWGLMNIAYKTDDKIRSAILRSFTPADALRCLTEMSNEPLAVTRLMGFLRNLINDKEFTGTLIPTYGNSIAQSVIFVLEGDYRQENKEQALCVLVNLSNNLLGKELIINNEDIRNKIFNYLMYQPYPPFQITAACAVCNLLSKEDPGFNERRSALLHFGVNKLLYQVQNTTKDHILLQSFAQKASEISWKCQGNRGQFEFNEELMNDLKDLKYYLSRDSSSSGTKAPEILEDIDDTILHRQKLIRIADRSKGGRKTALEYEHNELAGDDEDELRIRSAESRALKSKKSSLHFSSTVSQKRSLAPKLLKWGHKFLPPELSASLDVYSKA